MASPVQGSKATGTQSGPPCPSGGGRASLLHASVVLRGESTIYACCAQVPKELTPKTMRKGPVWPLLGNAEALCTVQGRVTRATPNHGQAKGGFP